MKKTILLFASVFVFLTLTSESCEPTAATTPTSASGVQKMNIKVQTDPNGHTSEQENIARKLKEDNLPGAIKHLYIISPYSGQTIIYSTVKGKVTSSTKRLTPNTVAALSGEYNHQGNFIPVNINGNSYRTAEVLQDDGTYGNSSEYIFWWDINGQFHQHYMTGGQIIHVSSAPLAVGKVTINLNLKP